MDKALRVGVILMLMCGVAVAGTCGTGYSFYRTVTIDHTKVPVADQSNYPVLFCANAASGVCNSAQTYLKVAGSGGNVQSSSGFDIIFCDAASAGTQLSHEIVNYVSTTGETEFFVKVGSLSHTVDSVIYLFYDKAGASDTQAVTSVWSNSYAEVWHLSAISGTPGIKDSTSTANNLTNHSTTNTTGLFDGAVAFASGSSQYLSGGTDSTATNVTVEAIFNPTTNSGFPMLGSTFNGGFTAGWELRIDQNSSDLQSSFLVADSHGICSWVWGSGGGFITPGSIYQMMGTASSSTLALYVNGAAGGSQPGTACTALVASAQGVNLGARNATNFYNGWMQEFRVSTVARSANWALMQYNNLNSPSTFYTIGSAQVPTSGSNHYFPQMR